MYENRCIAMILAGGRGERLGALTRYYAKPAIRFGSVNKIIDFTLNNCKRSGIDTIGVLTQHLSTDLHTYINVTYNDSRESGPAYMLPPQRKDKEYTATADAVYKNVEFIKRFRPENVLILSGDHIYDMDYSQLIAFHTKSGADATVASTLVPLTDASRFGILSASDDGRIHTFEEKPARPKSCLASMGVYVFKWDVLKKLLIDDSRNEKSHHDFGKDIIPGMLSSHYAMYTYPFHGYWRDIGTVESLWAANMDLLADTLPNQTEAAAPGSAIPAARHTGIDRSMIARDCKIMGSIKHSILADSVTVEEGAEVVDSVVMPGAFIGKNAKIYKTIVGTGARILNRAEIGAEEGTSIFVDRNICNADVSLIEPWTVIPTGMRILRNSQICMELFMKRQEAPLLMPSQLKTASV